MKRRSTACRARSKRRRTETEAIKEIEGALAKGPRRGPKPADEAGAGEEGVEDEAA
jgi:CarD family transcriptional regulator